ncbi:MAG: flagellar protein FliT [Burkholderiaceae bacterium]
MSEARVEEPRRSSLLQHYQAIAQASCAMLAAAHANDWDEVERLEERCCTLIANLKAAADSNSMGAAEEALRIQFLRSILADDAQIRDHAEPWLKNLSTYVSTKRTGEDNETP